MKTYEETVAAIKTFLKEQNMTAADMARITESLCTCKSCKHFIQHYNADRTPVECGHCVGRKTPVHRKPDQRCCGHWEFKEAP